LGSTLCQKIFLAVKPNKKLAEIFGIFFYILQKRGILNILEFKIHYLTPENWLPKSLLWVFHGK